MIGKFVGTGAYIPPTIWDNNKIAEIVETSDEWIKERTGIASRHIEQELECSQMAIEAARKALADSEKNGMTADDIDAVFVSTTSTDTLFPVISCMIQKELGCKNAFCYDLNAACSGFVFAYNMAVSYMNTGVIKTALIVGAEKLSNVMDWTDRGSCILFGDGAGAAVITAVEGTPGMVMHSDGASGDALMCNVGQRMTMDGQKVFRFAVKAVPGAVEELMQKRGLSDTDVDWYILHQANMRIIESAVKRLGISMDKVPTNIANMGNTSSASIPILLDECRKNGTIKDGERIVMSGFGAGLSYGAAYAVF
jgi:3-oxoacyl-[acyl-carrier-protein] synthase-3